MADNTVVVLSDNRKDIESGGGSASPSTPPFRRQVSYGSQVSHGSYIPYFTIDSERLKSLLSGQGGASYELVESASLKSSHNFPKELTQKDTLDSAFGTTVSSRVTTPCVVTPRRTSINDTVVPSFLTECDFQVHRLFCFMEMHLSKVERELAAVSHSRNVNINRSSERESSGNSDSLTSSESSETSPLLDSGVVEDGQHQNRDTVGVLCHVREILLSLQESLNASFESLDRLIAIHDDEALTTSGALYRESTEVERQNFDNRLSSNLNRINSKLASLEKTKELKIDHQGRLRTETITTANVRNTPVGCFIYLTFLLYVLLWVIISFMYYWDETRTWVVFLRLTRGPLLVVLFLYFFGTNMKGWANCGVDYVAIFNYNSDVAPTPNYVFKIAKLFTILFAAGIVGLLIVNRFHAVIPMKIFPILMWLSLLLFWINPFNLFQRKARFGSILSTVRIIISPLIFVYFTDFWFADQLNSLVAIMLDFQYMVCYTALDKWTGPVDSQVCTTSSNGIRPIISCLPALWRLLQCLRCYYDTHKIKHLLNAGKYFTTFPVIVFATLFAVKLPRDFDFFKLDFDDVGWIIVLWLISSFIHALYTYIWDVICDWGLFDIGKKTFLRPRILYRSRCFYYLAIICDFFLRFAWAIKLSLAIAWHLDSDVIYTVLVFGEISRRFVWNFFRIEYEHVVKNLD